MKRAYLLLWMGLTVLVLTAQAQSGPGRPARGGGRGDFSAAPLPKDEVEKKILGVLGEINPNDGREAFSVPRDDGRLLRLLAESINAKRVVELGTSFGYSGIWFCLALRTTGGQLITYEIDPQRAAAARNNFKRAGVSELVTVVEGDAHEQVTRLKEPVDLVFLDADKQGYADYLAKLLPLVRPGGLVVAHNIDRNLADPRYVQAITTNAMLETVFVNAGAGGISVTMKKR